MLASSQVVAHATARAGGPSARAQARPAAGYVRPLAQLRGARGARFLAAPAPAHARRAVRSQAVRVSAIFGGLEKLIKGDPSEKTREKYQGTVAKINSYAAAIAELSDEQLRAKTEQFKQALANGVTLDSILPEAFAVAREASERVLGLRPFDVQLIGGLILHEGQIAEMRTGEGKTLVAVLPAYLNALTGKGVHVVTVNDYLARRDCEWVGQVHRFLGLSVGLVQQGMTEKDRRAAYASDVTYVTNSEVGFDYLRDNLATSLDELVLREFNFCVIDEVDSILIDEARTPLIISGPADKPSDRYVTAAKMADAFQKGVHYKVDEKQRSVTLSEEGYEAAEELLQVKDLYDPRTQWALYLINAIKAKELQKKDVNYIVKNGEIIIVDEFTGRTMQGRRWSDGLHQAVEAKEGVAIQNETVTIASVTYQSFFRNYKKLSGMTGTAATEVTEFGNIYNLIVQVVPTNRPNSRADSPDVVFRLATAKWNAVVTEVARMNKKGRPCLVGTTSVEQSENLSRLLTEKGIAHEVLNAKPENVQREAEIVAQSGRVGAVTISTNMAGRGTDILLGGNPEYMARLKLREALMPKIVAKEDDEISFEKRGKTGVVDTSSKWKVDPKIYPVDLSDETKSLVDAAVRRAVNKWGDRSLPALEAEDRLSRACEKGPLDDDVLLGLRVAFEEVYGEFKRITDVEKDEVKALGGLHVVGTERHESRRIDNQLRGRAGRQGDPGSTRFFLSLEDNLFRIFGGDRVQALMQAFRVEDLPIESSMLSSSLDEAQKKVETYFYDIRKQLFEYDQVLNSQREKVYAERRKALRSSPDELAAVMMEYAELTVDDICNANIDQAKEQAQWDFDALDRKLKQYCPQLAEKVTPELLQEKAKAGGFEGLRQYLREEGKQAYRDKNAYVEGRQKGLMAEAERYFVLSQTDNLWKEHLQAIKFVQQAVGLRGYAQRDPLIEYKLEGYNLFVEMMAQIRRNVIYSVYCFEFKKGPTAEGAAAGAGAEQEGKKEPAAAGAGAGGNGAGAKKAAAGGKAGGKRK